MAFSLLSIAPLIQLPNLNTINSLPRDSKTLPLTNKLLPILFLLLKILLPVLRGFFSLL